MAAPIGKIGNSERQRVNKSKIMDRSDADEVINE